MHETPYKEGEPNHKPQSKQNNRPGSPAVSRHVKFLDEDVILNASELAEINNGLDDKDAKFFLNPDLIEAANQAGSKEDG